MPGEVDALIDELFPDAKHNTRAAPVATKIQSDWDSPVKGSLPTTTRSRDTVQVVDAPPQTVQLKPKEASSGPSNQNSFDDDSDDDRPHGSTPAATNAETYLTTSATNLHGRLTVPFPVLQEGLCAACHQQAIVSGTPNEAVYHPTLADLHQLHRVIDHNTPVAQVLRRKGAIHVSYPDPEIGNGVGASGCVHITCRRCDHLVVRLQNAAWDDNGGTLDLYLALRNYYPDWSRLASLTSASGDRAPLLVHQAGCAAYCCQCSWLTAHDNATILTSSMDLVTFNKTTEKFGGTLPCPFATHVPVPPTESRRPPLWECRGHNAFQ